MEDTCRPIMESEKEFAVIKFYFDGKYAICAQKNKTVNSGAYIVGVDVSIQWRRCAYNGIVLFSDGKQQRFYLH